MMVDNTAKRQVGLRGLRSPRSRTILLVALATLLAAAAAAAIVPQLLPDPGAGPAVLGVTEVVVRDRAFSPPVIQVEPGATVTWTVEDGGEEHNVVGPDWASDVLASGDYRQTFLVSGSYPYRCTLHQGMTGRVDVAKLATGASE